MVLMGMLVCQTALASDIVVLGRLVTNEPMSYVQDECPENAICMRSWWKSVIRVDKTVKGRPLSGRVTAAVMQHTWLNSRYKKAVRLFVLAPIEDPAERARLRADYYLDGMSEPRSMFCLAKDPRALGLTEKKYTAGAGEDTTYCFELPGL